MDMNKVVKSQNTKHHTHPLNYSDTPLCRQHAHNSTIRPTKGNKGEKHCRAAALHETVGVKKNTTHFTAGESFIATPPKMHCLQRKGSLHLPAHIYLSPLNVCEAAALWPFAALRLIPSLMLWCCLHWPPLTTNQLLFVFVAIGLLSTSIHLCLSGCDVNPKWLIKGKPTSKRQHLRCHACTHFPQYPMAFNTDKFADLCKWLFFVLRKEIDKR